MLRRKISNYATIFIVFGIYVATNVYFTQNHPQYLYDLLHTYDSKATIRTYAIMLQHPHLLKHATTLLNTSGQSIQEDIQNSSTARSEKIKKYQAILDANPQSTEVLLLLSRLYTENGESNQAQRYLDQAQKIDPRILTINRR